MPLAIAARWPVRAWTSIAHMAVVTQALIDNRFTEAEIRMIMGANTLRVLETVLPEE